MKIKLISLIASITLGFFLFPAEANACSCREWTPCESFNNASVVFIGRAVSSTHKLPWKNSKGEAVEQEAGTVTFSVEQSYKGIGGPHISIHIMSVCSPMGITKGERYLLYAYESQGQLVTGSCHRSRAADTEYAKEDLQFLHNLPKEGVGGRLYGEVGVNKGGGKPVPLAGITVIAENETRQQFKVVTDDKGRYELSGLKPGKYQVTSLLPAHYEVYEPEREISISDRGCASNNYWANINGMVSGRVVDAQGRRAPARLRLVSVENARQSFLGSAYNDGEFEIDGVPPGRYLLYVEIVSAYPDTRQVSKKEPFYYPGVFEPKEAKIIELGLGEKQNAYEFTLPEKLKVQTITGVIQYPDGRPAGNAAVILSIPDKTPPGIYRTDEWGSGRIETDESGRFEIHAFKGNTYQLEAQEGHKVAIEAKRRQLYSEPKIIKLEGDVNDVKLVLSSPTSFFERRMAQPQKKTPQ
jgi:hypothetical protein